MPSCLRTATLHRAHRDLLPSLHPFPGVLERDFCITSITGAFTSKRWCFWAVEFKKEQDSADLTGEHG